MEKILSKLAKQLDALDEASLMNLWTKYAKIVNNFEPSKRWEEAVLIFSLIQAKQWKNQLFNHHWSRQIKPNRPIRENMPAFAKLEREKPAAPAPKADILSFRPRAAKKDGAETTTDKGPTE